MVALRDTESFDSLVTLACQLANGMAADLVVLHVVEMPAATPLEAHDPALLAPGQDLLAAAQRVAAGCCTHRVDTKLLRAREVGEAIVGELQDQGAALLVVGDRHPDTMGEILLGSTVRYLARHAPCRVIVQIPPGRQR
jgi:nucleotide-binding universal stress UspA family protein